MAYYVGMLANLLPLPGGIGGVDGGMIGALIAFDVDGGAALVAVLSYRFFAFWLPTDPRRRRLLPARAHGAPTGARTSGAAGLRRGATPS